jgi:hypothetical protein
VRASFGGEHVIVQSRARQSDKDISFCQPSRQIFVANINFDKIGDRLEGFFSAFGKIER